MSEFDKKISALTSGSDSQAADEYVIARGGANYKITGANIAAAATKLGTIATGVWQGTAIANTYIATGLDVTKLTTGATLPSNVLASSLTSVGTLSSLTVSGAITSTLTSGIVLTNTSGGTNATQFRLNNTGGDMRIGIESSAGQAIQTGTSAYAAVFGNQANYPTQFTTNGITRMTLDASGNLGVGTTPSYRLHAFTSSGTIARFTRDLTTDVHFDIGADNDGTILQASGVDVMRFWTGSTERARITSGGLFQVTADGSNQTFTNSGQIALKNTGSAPYISWHESTGARIGYLQMQATGAANFYVEANQPLVFATNNTERARITSGGFVKASNTGTYASATGTNHEFRTDQTNTVIEFNNSHASAPYGLYIGFSAASPDNNSEYYLRCQDSTTARCYIWSDGDLANHDGVYGTISDERLKQDIVDAGSQWDDLKAVRFRKYRMKTDVAADENAPYQLGVIAQELEQTSPGLVDEHPDYEEQEVTDEDGNVTTEKVQVGTTKSVKSSILLMKAAVALQEAMARIEALEARLEALDA